ncbi:MAG: Ig-like domain-containing protein [Methanobacterium sp.]
MSVPSIGGEFNVDSNSPSISADGRYVAFTLHEELMVAGLGPIGENGFGSIFFVSQVLVHDRISKTTRVVSISSTGNLGNGFSGEPSINADGSVIAFSSWADNLVTNDTNNHGDIFVHNMDTTSNISAVIYPEIVKSGDQITVRAHDPNSVNITALILGQTLNMEKSVDGFWYLNYTILNAPDGIYDVLLTSTDNEDHQNQININFIVDNTPPEISGKVTPNIIKSGNYISINAFTSSDTISITTLILGETYDLHKQSNGNWNLYYTIPKISDGTYPVLLTSTDKAGNQNTISLNFTVDNRSPNVSGSLNPETVKPFDKINITATSDPDTSSITALIFNKTYNLIKQTEGTWNLQYTVPHVHDGNYFILLTATDNVGNQGTFSLNFNVFNPVDSVPPAISGTITHAHQLNGVFLERPWITIKAFTDPDTVSVVASIADTNYTLTRQEDGSWLSSSRSWLRGGSYTALLTAKDWSGNQGISTVNFTVENIIPTMTTTIYPKRLRSGDLLTLNVNVSPDAKGVRAFTPSGFVSLEKQPNGSWSLQYTVPQLRDGDHTIFITALYGIGWRNPRSTTLITKRISTRFTVDNTPPYITGSAVPNILKSGDTLKITAFSKTRYIDDTVNVTVTILGQTFDMTKIGSRDYMVASRYFMEY